MLDAKGIGGAGEGVAVVDMRLEVVVLPVSDVARAELAGRGVAVSDVFHDAILFHHAGTAERVPGPAPDHQTPAETA